MSETASVILTGEVMPGHIAADVIVALAKVLKTTEERAGKLLAGRETVIKREVPVAQVGRYIEALGSAGAKARIQRDRVETGGFPEIVEPKSAPAPVAAPAPALIPEPVPPSIAPSTRVAEITPTARAEPSPFAGLSLVDAPVANGPASAPASSSEKHEATCPECGKGQAFRSMCRYCGAHMDLASAKRPPAAGNSDASIYAAPQSRDWREPVYEDFVTPPIFGMSTEGRIGRLRYLAYIWPIMLAAGLGGILAAMLVPRSPVLGVVLLVPVFVIAFWLMMRLAVMRLHDLNRSGKWIIAVFVLFAAVGGIGSNGLLLVVSGLFWIGSLAVTCWPGSSSSNDFGPPPGPNTLWVKIGAGVFIALQVLSIVANYKYANYRDLARSKRSMVQPADDQNFTPPSSR